VPFIKPSGSAKQTRKTGGDEMRQYSRAPSLSNKTPLSRVQTRSGRMGSNKLGGTKMFTNGKSSKINSKKATPRQTISARFPGIRSAKIRVKGKTGTIESKKFTERHLPNGIRCQQRRKDAKPVIESILDAESQK